ncbi:MAG: hypothetical protein ACOCWS_03510 [Alkalispirochaetaceae bacterium]
MTVQSAQQVYDLIERIIPFRCLRRRERGEMVVSEAGHCSGASEAALLKNRLMLNLYRLVPRAAGTEVEGSHYQRRNLPEPSTQGNPAQESTS